MVPAASILGRVGSAHSCVPGKDTYSSVPFPIHTMMTVRVLPLKSQRPKGPSLSFFYFCPGLHQSQVFRSRWPVIGCQHCAQYFVRCITQSISRHFSQNLQGQRAWLHQIISAKMRPLDGGACNYRTEPPEGVIASLEKWQLDFGVEKLRIARRTKQDPLQHLQYSPK